MWPPPVLCIKPIGAQRAAWWKENLIQNKNDTPDAKMA
jgi:hypothetical protein